MIGKKIVLFSVLAVFALFAMTATASAVLPPPDEVTCVPPPPPKLCRGTCCCDSNCTEPYALNMTCKECVICGNKYWKPNKDEACFNDVEPYDLCLNWCPQCCNGADDDCDGFTDFPCDQNCTCGLDPSEVEKLPPVPEASTIVLMGVGLLAMTTILLARGRRRGE
jgi:hypothetical protein